jgi:prepilin-type N-terminal cleavage/methylation domain-containing protein
MKSCGKQAFTLIELLIVVAIIAILAAIAVPNFLEAQTRSKVSRVKADQRSIATAAEAYAVDYNKYPPNRAVPQYRMDDVQFFTTPVAYISSLPSDPFIPRQALPGGTQIKGFQYFNYDRSIDLGPANTLTSWGVLVASVSGTRDIKGSCVKSYGPDAGKKLTPGPALPGDDGGEWAVFGLDKNVAGTLGINLLYDPTNGTVSAGDVLRFMGDTNSVPQVPN